MSKSGLLKKTVRLVKRASRFMRDENFSVAEKGSATNIVTTADTSIQSYLQKHLIAMLPGSTFFGEEEQRGQERSEFLWIVDPIDGTMNFARGIADCAISVALLQNGEPVLGVVYSLRKKELFTAEKGGGAYLNGRRITVSDKPFSDGLFCTAFSLYQKEHAAPCISLLTDVYHQCNDFRRFGTCALELCYLAAGRCDLYFEIRVYPWDHAAAGLILREAGGFISSLGGEPLSYDLLTPLIAANTRENFDRLVQKVSQHIPEITYQREF